MTMRKSATEPLVENHLWPSITHSSPSRTARVRSSVGSDPATSGSVIENADRRSPASSGASQRSFCSSVPAMARTSLLPESVGWLPNALGASGELPRISCMSPRRTWPKPWPPSSGGRWAAHRPCSLTVSRSGASSRSSSSWVRSSASASSGQTSSRTKARIQASLASNSGSVEKSHGMPRSASHHGSGFGVRGPHYAGRPVLVRVVIIGATGNVGTALIGALAGEDAVDDVVGIARRRPSSTAPKTTWAPADISRDDLVPLLRGADVVVHLAWLIQPSRDESVTHATNVEGSSRVFAAAAQAGVPAIVYASSVGAYAPGPKDRLVDESWPTTGIATSIYTRD